MPKLWTETIAAHRQSVREAILDTTWALVADCGLLSVTMSRIAAETGIGRATLYKYFPDVESILRACHQRHVAQHMARLSELRDQRGTAEERLEAVLEAFALISFHRSRHGTEELGALLHRGSDVVRAEKQVLELIQGLVSEVASADGVRDDVTPGELAAYCLHAVSAASSLPSEAAVRRLVMVTMDGLRPRH